MNFSTVSTLHLLVELLYEGKSGLIPELERYEPIDLTKVCSELAERSGTTSLTNSPQQWLDWYLESSLLSDKDRNTLVEMIQFKKKNDAFLQRFRR